jgi:hypothetical protein
MDAARDVRGRRLPQFFEKGFPMSNTVETIIDQRVKLNTAAFAAVRDFRRAKPWQGTFEERLAKFQSLLTGLNAAYGLGAGLMFHGQENREQPGNGAYDSVKDVVHLVGKLSVVTMLHCVARARGMTRQEAFRWSLSVFKKMFPVSFGRCHSDGLILIR